MKKFAHISLIFIYLLANTEVGQIAAIPNLFKHFKDHQNVNYTLSFIEFLEMHYGGNDGNPNDDKQDSELPFHQANSGSTIVSIPNIASVTGLFKTSCLETLNPYFNTLITVSNFPGNLVFRPPIINDTKCKFFFT